MNQLHFFPSRTMALYVGRLFLVRSFAILFALVLVLQTLDLLGESDAGALDALHPCTKRPMPRGSLRRSIETPASRASCCRCAPIRPRRPAGHSGYVVAAA